LCNVPIISYLGTRLFKNQLEDDSSIFEKTGDFNKMKKNLALSAMLVVSALGMACGGAANSNVANTANSANGNRTTNVASNSNMMAVNANQMAMNANMKAENVNQMAGNTMMNSNTMMNGNRMMNANK